MLVVVSPAKRLDLKPVEIAAPSQPAFQEDASTLAGYARKLSVAELRKLMRISDSLARLNAGRFAEFADTPTADATKPAVLAFAGDTYTGLDAATLDDHAMTWAQAHLRILSGLYGVLRPLDLIQPYRLEMGSRLKTQRGGSLYEYWGPRIAEALKDASCAAGTDILVNCASVEYFSAVERRTLGLRVITPVFVEDRQGTTRIVSFFAKKARGAMARFMVENHLTDPATLKEFDTGGYRFEAGLSEGDRWVFRRACPEA